MPDTRPAPRTANRADVPRLREIEESAGTAFLDIGMDEIARDEPPPAATYLEAIGREQIRVLDDGAPVAYLRAIPLDEALHIEQVSVAATHARRGLGRILIDDAAHTARALGLRIVTLTTFGEVPWNAPYYTRLGFRCLPEHEWGSGLRQVRADERARGLDRWPRVALYRAL